MSLINLRNPRLRTYIRQYLGIEKFGEPYATIIEEVFMRENHVLNLSPEEFQEDLSNFKYSVNSIGFKEYAGRSMGYYSPGEKKIVLNYSYWKEIAKNYPSEIYYLKLFETISHESLHGAQNIVGTTKNRAGGYNIHLKSRSHAIYEICTQATAAKMTYGRQESDYYNNTVLSGDGYADEIFAIPLIASTFGVDERDVLKFGLRERDKLVKVLNKNIGNYSKTLELVDHIETQLEYLHSIHYPDDNQISFKKMTDEQKKEASTNVLINLMKLSQEVMVYRIKNTPINFSKDIAVQYKYDQKKIYDTLQQEFTSYGGEFNKGYGEFLMMMKVGVHASYIDESINVFNQIGKEIDKYGMYSSELVNAVVNEDFETCRKMGIVLKSGMTFSLIANSLDFRQKKANKDYNDFNQWDNIGIFEAFSQNKITSKLPIEPTSDLKKWNDVYSVEGHRKKRLLKAILKANKAKFNVNSKEFLLRFLNADSQEMSEVNLNFTRSNHGRDIFMSEFQTVDDKEFLAKLMAEKYFERYFFPNGESKKVDTQEEKNLQDLFKPTIMKYGTNGKKQFLWGIAQILINDNYQGISGEDCRQTLAIYGKNQIYDMIAQPLIDELLDERKIDDKKRMVLQATIYETEKNHPRTTSSRIEEFIKLYKKSNIIDTKLFSQNGREKFSSQFNSSRNMEDFVGIICEDYSKYYLKKNMQNNTQLDRVKLLMYNIIINYGEDFFRENMIRVILNNDYSELEEELGTTFPNVLMDLKNMSPDYLLYELSNVFVESTMEIESLKNRTNSDAQVYVKPSDLQEVVKAQKMSFFRKSLNRFINVRSSNNQVQEKLYQENDFI